LYRNIDGAIKLMASAQTTASTLAMLNGDYTRRAYMQQRIMYMADVLQVIDCNVMLYFATS
jgi:hypothetical protein